MITRTKILLDHFRSLVKKRLSRRFLNFVSHLYKFTIRNTSAANKLERHLCGESIQHIDLRDDRSIKFLCKSVDRRLFKIQDVEQLYREYRRILDMPNGGNKRPNPYLVKLLFDFSINRKTDRKIYKMLHEAACDLYDIKIKTKSKDRLSSIPLLLGFLEGLGLKLDFIVDVGFARGTPDLTDSFKNAFYYAIDPAPENLRWMEKFINERDNSVMHSLALSDKVGEAFLVSSESATNSELVFSKNEANQKNGHLVTKVKVDTLDNLIQGYDVSGWGYLKIDAEGNDYRVLKGGKAQLHRFALIQVELRLDDPSHPNSMHKVSKFLAIHGFSFFRAYNYNYNTKGMLRQCDAIFVNQIFIKNIRSENEPRTAEQIEMLKLIRTAKREFKAKKQMTSNDAHTASVS